MSVARNMTITVRERDAVKFCALKYRFMPYTAAENVIVDIKKLSILNFMSHNMFYKACWIGALATGNLRT